MIIMIIIIIIIITTTISSIVNCQKQLLPLWRHCFGTPIQVNTIQYNGSEVMVRGGVDWTELY